MTESGEWQAVAGAGSWRGLGEGNVNTITWLHLSDLHFRVTQKHTSDGNIVLTALLRDVAERIDQDGLQPDFVSITGDVAFSGKGEEYDLAEEFLDELLQVTGLTKNRLFIVPGNHDVDRSLISFAARAMANAVTDRDSANEVLADSQNRRLMFDRFEGYKAFVNRYWGDMLPFDSERYFYVRTLDLAGRRIALLGLNSAWLCASDEDRANGLLVGEFQTRMALEQAEGADLKIALLHHPFHWLREFDQRDSATLLNIGCDFILHGHLHRAGAIQLSTPDSEAMLLACGACYETRQYTNRYNLVCLDFAASQGTVYFRCYSDQSGGFWAKDTTSYRNAPDGYYEFALGKRFRPAGGFAEAKPWSAAPVSPDRVVGKPAKVFISYSQGTEPDEGLALHIYHSLLERGHEPFVEQAMNIGTRWAGEIQRKIESSDFLLVLLSPTSVSSEMVTAEIRCAHEHGRKRGRPRILPIRVAFADSLPYELGAYLDALQYGYWQQQDDTSMVTLQVQNAVEAVGTLPQEPTTVEPGREMPSAPRPQPAADPRLLVDLRTPRGVVGLGSRFYIERRGDFELKREVLGRGSLAYIWAARQTGKSSLLIRGVQHAREQGRLVALVDSQLVDAEHLTSLDAFLYCLAELIANALGIGGVNEEWQSSLASTIKMSNFLQEKVLKPAESPVLLAIDEADRIYGTQFQRDFFGMVRAWHNRSQSDMIWNKASIAMVISTEPYLLIDDPMQSPFNVGTRIELEDFDEVQVGELNRRHGSPLPPDQVRDVMEFLGGHPYLTRMALYVMLTEQLTWTHIVNLAVGVRSPFRDHLRHYLWLLRGKPDLARAIKRIIKTGTCPDESIFHRLQAAGLIRRKDSECVCRCTLYESFLERHL